MMENKVFELKEEHIKLLCRAYVGWEDCEFGAPAIDCKRPYGNSSVEQDMLEILGLEEVKKGIYEIVLFGKEYLLTGEDKYNIDLEDEQELFDALNALHKETKVALQIILVTKSFKAGRYEAGEYSTDWKLVSV